MKLTDILCEGTELDIKKIKKLIASGYFYDEDDSDGDVVVLKCESGKKATVSREAWEEFKEENLTEAWTKLGKHKGILSRTVTPADRAAAEKREADRAKKRSATKKAAKLSEPIPDLETDEIEDLALQTGVGFSGTIDHIINKKRGLMKVDGQDVAYVNYTLFLDIGLKNDLGFDDETIEKMYHGNTHTEETATFKVMRDPKDPKKLIGTW